VDGALVKPPTKQQTHGWAGQLSEIRSLESAAELDLALRTFADVEQELGELARAVMTYRAAGTIEVVS
jgi:hypothetical protein